MRGVFRVREDRRLQAVETAYAGFGPGLPAPRPGDAWRTEDGMIVVAGPDEPLPEIRVRVAPITRHRLETPTRSLDLSAATGDGAAVVIRVE